MFLHVDLSNAMHMFNNDYNVYIYSILLWKKCAFVVSVYFIMKSS